MLKELQIKNFAIIDDITVRFGPGLNVLSGETGAGKTLIIEAINMLIGERADSELIRDGQDKLTVQGYFDLRESEKSINLLKEENLADEKDDFSEIVISREVNRQGKNRAFINGIFTQVSTLKNFGKCFLDMHGQHDHQYLLDSNTHLEIIDNFGKKEITSIKADYAAAYKNFIESAMQLVNLKKLQKDKEIKLEDLKFRSGEIEKLNFKNDEESELENEKNILKNHEKIFKICTFILTTLNGEENNNISLIENFSLLLKNISELSQIDKKFERFTQEAESAYPSLVELSGFLKEYTDSFDYSAEKLDIIQERLYKISEIKRKYGMEIPQIKEYAAQLKKEILGYEGLDEEINQKLHEYKFKKEILAEYAYKLSILRKKVIKTIEQEVREELDDLSFKFSKFEISHKYNPSNAVGVFIEIDGQKLKPSINGIDSVEFLISLNAGESVKPLVKIASGGEISRIMLALKSIVSGMDNIITMIFDEIDSGIGGSAGIIAGKKLYNISKRCQVLCITHLPQIAAFAEHNYFIEKVIDADRTKINIFKLNEDKKVKEISRMLSGMADSEISLKHAEELISETKNMKNIDAIMEKEIKKNLEVEVNKIGN